MSRLFSPELANKVRDVYDDLLECRKAATSENFEELAGSFIVLIAMQNRALSSEEKNFLSQHIVHLSNRIVSLGETTSTLVVSSKHSNTSSMPSATVVSSVQIS